MTGARGRLDHEAIRQAHAASCRAIVEARGHNLTRATTTERVGPCPKCGGTDRFGINIRKNIWNCRQCAAGGDAIALVQHLDGISFREAVEIITGKRSADSRPEPPKTSRRREVPSNSATNFPGELWKQAVDPRGTLAETYIQSRDLTLKPELALRVLRFHPHCPFGEGERHPCLIAAFEPIEGIGGEPVTAIFRTPLNRAGEKIGKGKALGSFKGQAIKLDADETVTDSLGIGEGPATCMSVRSRGWGPVWCLGGTAGVSSFPPLAGIEALTIFADHDENGAGMQAAEACARQWRAAGREVRIWMPKGAGRDWNDEART